MLRLTQPLAALLVALALAACGDSSDETTTPTAPGAEQGDGGGPSGPSSGQVRTCAADRAGFSALQASGVPCTAARRVMLAWKPSPPCAPPPGGSRASCSVLGYRCLSVAVGTGVRALAVSCARPGRSISFGYAAS